ncbi:PCTP-like protein [Microtus ochrogaster]|uniref:PCTP-like protein n=1 Tax=Microtus ochrogaster TaxID=79684 RepID=A0A8J6GEL1_MICOH|nr:PCTP-like protein [Microtus ochrogaster]
MASASAAASTLSEPPRRTQESRTRTRAPGLPTLPMEKPAASMEPQGPRPALGRESVQHQPHFKPWLHPEQSPLPSLALSELSVQHADSLENIDESAVAESREEQRAGGAGGEGSDDDTSLT